MTITKIEAMECTVFETTDETGKSVRIIREFIARPPIVRAALENASTTEIIEEAGKIYHKLVEGNSQRAFKLYVSHEGRKPKGFDGRRAEVERIYLPEKQ